MLSDKKINDTESESQKARKVIQNFKIRSCTGQHDHNTGQIINNKVAPPHGGTKHRNIDRNQCSVTEGRTIDQRQQDPLVLSNKFQKLQHFVDEQEQDQQTPHMSFGSVSSPVGTKNAKELKNVKNNSPCDNRAKVDDIQELTFAQQDKNTIGGQ